LKSFFVFLFLCGSLSVYGQVLDTKLDGNEKDMLLSDFLLNFETKHPVKFFYLSEWIDRIRIQNNYKDAQLGSLLEDALRGTDISFIELYGYAVILSKDPAQALKREDIIRNARVEQKKIEFVTLGNRNDFRIGEKVTISGIVSDDKTKEPVGGVTVAVSDMSVQTSTLPDGTYSLIVPKGDHILTFQNLNYDDKVYDLKVYADGVVNVTMTEVPKLLEEVVVSDQRLNMVNDRGGQTNLKINDLKKLPAFLGEVDIMKQIQTLPGVTSVGEVSSGYNVRGGGVDQNLVLYDGVQVFNNSHVFGFFSAFNSESIKDATFYKGGIPSEFGGRVSSVLSVSSKEGNYKKWEGSGGIGLISSNLSIGGPIKKDVSSVLVSARSSYSDWMLKSFAGQYKNVKNSSVSFYDISVKLTRKFGPRNKLFFSAYVSHDHFGLPSDTTFAWRNVVGSMHFDHIFNEHLFSSVSLGYGQYSYQVDDADKTTAYSMRYKISYPTFNADFNYQRGSHKIVFGINSNYYEMNPGSIKPTSSESSVVPVTINTQHSLENALFISDAVEVGNRFHIEGGFRFSMFSSLGAAKVYTYESNQPLNETTRTDSMLFSSGQVIKNYFGPEPRLSARFTLTPNSSVKLGYNRMYQYIHLISNSVAVSPIDIWQASNYYFKPQIGDQISLGYFTDLKDNTYELSAEGFYKQIKNVLDFKDGSQLVLNPTLERSLLKGIGKSYGVEFLLNKTKGRFSGSLNYTYSRSFRKVAGKFDEETINGGNYYRANNDQPHVANLNWKYGISRRFSFTGNFTYRTGRPITVPYSYAVIDNIPVVNFSGRNEYRVPDYHRLDLALVIEGSHRRKKFWDGTWTISIYNVYARKNVYTIFYQKNANGIQSAYRMSIVGTALPSISYKFKF